MRESVNASSVCQPSAEYWAKLDAARADALAYARTIRNAEKRAYALAFIAFRFGDAACPERPDGLSYMGAQAVRHNCEALYRLHFPVSA